MQQYFVKENIENNKKYILSADDSNHIVRIMRKKIGDKIYVVFNNKEKYICEIIENNIDAVKIIPFEKVLVDNELEINVCVAIPPLKGDKLEYLIQKITELGVSSIVIFNSERNVSKLKKDKIELKLSRWQKIIKEAAEQSKRNIIPSISYEENIDSLIKYSSSFEYKLVAYEKESNNFENNNFSLFLKSSTRDKNVIAIFGSEGGLSEKEVDKFETNDFKLITLGKRILRAETAPLYLMSCISYFSEFE